MADLESKEILGSLFSSITTKDEAIVYAKRLDLEYFPDQYEMTLDDFILFLALEAALYPKTEGGEGIYCSEFNCSFSRNRNGWFVRKTETRPLNCKKISLRVFSQKDFESYPFLVANEFARGVKMMIKYWKEQE